MKYSPKTVTLSLLLKTIVVIAAAIGVLNSMFSNSEVFMGGRHVFMFFTIQSNILIALVCAYGMRYLIRQKPAPDIWHLIKFVSTVSITLTGMVFCFVLAPTFGETAWMGSNVLTHVVVPVCAVLDYFVTCKYGNVSKNDVFWVTIPPLLYAVYAGIGYLAGWEFIKGKNYPYFFLNWGSPAGAFGFTDSLPFMGVVWWILLLLAFLIAVGYLYLWIGNRLKARSERREKTTER